MKKRLIFIISSFIAFLFAVPAMACEVCQDQQPRVLRNITHGAGPQGNIDYIITISAAIIVGLTLIYTIKYLVKPEEKSPDHVKNMIIDNY